MTKEEAIRIQDTILSKIRDTVPEEVVHPFWNTYKEFKGMRPNETMPCTCNGKLWVIMINEIKAAVEEALREQEIIPEVIESYTEEELPVAEPKETVKNTKSYYKRKK